MRRPKTWCVSVLLLILGCAKSQDSFVVLDVDAAATVKTDVDLLQVSVAGVTREYPVTVALPATLGVATTKAGALTVAVVGIGAGKALGKWSGSVTAQPGQVVRREVLLACDQDGCGIVISTNDAGATNSDGGVASIDVSDVLADVSLEARGDAGVFDVGEPDDAAGNGPTVGACMSGYHDGGDGKCVAAGSCSIGYHDGGAGACTLSGTCSAGYRDGGAGVCVVNGTCLNGYQDVGGTCMQLGQLGADCSTKPCQPAYTCRTNFEGARVCAEGP